MDKRGSLALAEARLACGAASDAASRLAGTMSGLEHVGH